MSSKETLTSFMDMLGFKEISYAFEFIAENNFSESQITALVREFTKPAIELIECKVCGKSLDVIEFLTSNYPNTCRNCVNKALGIDIDNLFENDNIIDDLEPYDCKKCDYNYSKDCNEGCRKLISEEEF